MKRLIEQLLSIGAYEGESENQRARRRIMVGSIWLITALSIPTIVVDFSAGFTWVGWGGVAIIGATVVGLAVLSAWPRTFPVTINLLFVVVAVAAIFEATLFGGLFESGLIVVFGLISVLGALVALGIRAAIWWCAVFALQVVYAAVIHGVVEPRYVMDNPSADAALNLTITGVVTLLVLIYFVRQRDRFQKESDDLLHNILPDEIADRLKIDSSMIADSYESASVLFADVVDFTPLSANMSAPELVGLLDEVFTAFDGFVEELGLEKIKTVGDAYMVAAGVPRSSPNHAETIAELALRIRDHVASHEFAGHHIRTRIGINSGPVVAGIIGSHKFAYDLWGDVVNTASRMESEGVPGSIQLTAATRDLIEDNFVCEPRGTIQVKGKGAMETFILVSRRSNTSGDLSADADTANPTGVQTTS
jgi:class 3 adenylate cyclase